MTSVIGPQARAPTLRAAVPRVYIASLDYEANTFSVVRTLESSFSGRDWGRDTDLDPASAAGVMVRECRSRGWDVVLGPYSSAEPGGPLPRLVYERIREAILDGLVAAGPVDAVLLFLHGAGVAEGEDDVEGAILEAVRMRLPHHVPILLEIDLHAHLTSRMLRNSTVIVGFKEYPHTDIGDRAVDLVSIAARTLAGTIRPVMAIAECRMMGLFYTNVEPLRSFVDRLSALERVDPIVSITFCHGMDEADVPEMGAKMLVVSDADIVRASALARELACEAFALRGRITPVFVTPFEAVLRGKSLDGLTVLADASDNPGAGHPGDATHVLHALRDTAPSSLPAAVVLYDPESARDARAAGLGQRVRLRVGGKSAAGFGEPVEIDVTVACIRERIVQRFPQLQDCIQIPSGAAVRVSAGNLHIVLMEERVQTYGTEFFVDTGVELASLRIVAVKSQRHFHAAFKSHASRVIDVWHWGNPGGANPYANLYFRRIPRPMWPLDDLPDGWLDASR